MKGYHFCSSNFVSKYGNEAAFYVGETRTIDLTELCERGYHGCPTPFDALVGGYLYGPGVEYCEFSGPTAQDEHKFVSQTKTVLRRAVLSQEVLFQFAKDCANRAKKYAACGPAVIFGAVACGAADAACVAATYAAADAATYAAAYAATYAAADAAAERKWQRETFDAIVIDALDEQEKQNETR